MIEAWRAFELLVTRIERAVSPFGAIVKSPDHLVDSVTGEPREVDASIRIRPDGSMVRVLECRDRAKVEDVTWIEQLATKSRDHGVPTTAVSSSGFSKQAAAKAKHYGIETRQISDIAQSEMIDWVKIAAVTHVIHFPELRSVNVEFCGEPGETGANVHPDVVQQLTEHNGNAPVFVRHDGGRRTRPTEILDEMLGKGLDLFTAIPTDGTTVQKQVVLRFPKRTFWIATDVGARDIAKLVLGVDVHAEAHASLLPDRGFRYHGTGRPSVYGMEAACQVLGSTVLVSFHREENSDNLRVTLSRGKGP